jgi:hypothetical protein
MMALPVTAAELVAKQKPQGAVDPNINVPKQVRDAGKRAEVIQRASIGEAEPSLLEPGAPAPGTPPNGAVPPTPSQASPPAPATPSQPLPEPTAAAPAPGGPAVGSGAVPPATPSSEPPVDWERQFKSLQGRFDQQRDAVTQMGNRLQQLESENTTLRAVARPPPDPNNPPVSLLTEQEIADYGPDFIDVVRRAVKEATDPLFAEINGLRGQVGTMQNETTNAFMSRMNSTLSAAVPNWEALNKDQKFIQWSQLPDVFSGAIRRQLMQDAWNSGDPNRLVAFFRAYLAEEAATDPQVAGAPRQPEMRTVVTPTPATFAQVSASPLHPGSPQLALSDLAAPGRAHSAAGQPAEKPVYSPQDITRFYTDMAAGRWRGREQQAQAIEADIMVAQREGRILPNTSQPAPPAGFTR